MRIRHEHVAPSRDVTDGPMITVAEDATNVGDCLGEGAFADHDLRPDELHQFFFPDHLAGPGTKDQQDFERLLAQTGEATIPRQQFPRSQVQDEAPDLQPTRSVR